jgi:hypothetical protein
MERRNALVAVVGAGDYGGSAIVRRFAREVRIFSDEMYFGKDRLREVEEESVRVQRR